MVWLNVSEYLSFRKGLHIDIETGEGLLKTGGILQWGNPKQYGVSCQ